MIQSTRHNKKLLELREAITTQALIREKDGFIIIGSEATGARDPWIFDFRAVMLQPEWLNTYAEIFWEKYGDSLPFQVGGMETAGIPLVAAIVMKGVERGTPINGFYMRKSRKRKGLMRDIEGTLNEHPVIFVDDLMNSGGSVERPIAVLEKNGKRVRDVFVILTFQSPDSYEYLRDKQIPLTSMYALPDFGMPEIKKPVSESQSQSYEILWHYEPPHPSFHLVVQKSAPIIYKERIYYGCDDGTFRALDARSGSCLWSFAVGKHPQGKGILSSPVIHGDHVYFGAYDGAVYALECDTGRKVWENTDADWIGSSPCIAPDKGLLYIGLEFGLWRKRGGIAAIDLGTGNTRWTAYHSGLTHGSPLYVHEHSLVVIGSNDGGVYAYDALEGYLKWSYRTHGDIKTRPAYDSRNDRVIVASMDGNLYALDAVSGTPAYAKETGKGIYSIPLVHDDTIYVGSLDKCVYAYDSHSGNIKWTFETQGRIFSSPVYHKHSIFIGSNDGRLYEIDTKSGKIKSYFQATERITNAPVIQGDFLYVPTVANEMYCITNEK